MSEDVKNVTWTDIKQAINDKQFVGFNSQAEAIGYIAKLAWMMNQEFQNIYLQMRLTYENKLHIFGDSGNHTFLFNNDFFKNEDGSRPELDLIDLCHFFALVIDEKKAVDHASK